PPPYFIELAWGLGRFARFRRSSQPGREVLMTRFHEARPVVFELGVLEVRRKDTREMDEDAVDERAKPFPRVINLRWQIRRMKCERVACHIFCIGGDKQNKVARDLALLGPARKKPPLPGVP